MTPCLDRCGLCGLQGLPPDRLQLTCSAEGPWKQNADDQSF